MYFHFATVSLTHAIPQQNDTKHYNKIDLEQSYRLCFNARERNDNIASSAFDSLQ